jgi:hypothetical protein
MFMDLKKNEGNVDANKQNNKYAAFHALLLLIFEHYTIGLYVRGRKKLTHQKFLFEYKQVKRNSRKMLLSLFLVY